MKLPALPAKAGQKLTLGQLVGSSLARIPTNMPYIPGLLSFRELPAVLQALGELPVNCLIEEIETPGEGQVRALAEMVDAGRPCEDIAQQMSAARKAMDKAFYRLMACSMLEAVNQGDSAEGVERSTRILEKYA